MIRQPAVAGAFYEAGAEALRRDLRARIPLRPTVTAAPAFGAIVPHAGYVYSGGVAGEVFARLEIPGKVVILCPNHTGRGKPAALDPSEAWRTPLGDVPVDERLSRRMLELAPSMETDAVAHAREHSLEVQLPFLQVLTGQSGLSIVPISIGAHDLELCREIGEACADLIAEEREAGRSVPLVLASSDMNHYESRAVGSRKDALALARVEEIDPEGLFATVMAESISMCGFLPCTALLFAARRARAGPATVVARADSGDETGDVSSVVGYAGVVIAPGSP